MAARLLFLFARRTTVLRPIMCAVLVATLATRSQSRGQTMPNTAADSLGRFPRVEGSNLEGEHFTLPTDFKGELNVVLIAFAREQQRDVDGWMPFLKTIAEARSDVRVYEIPTLGRRYRLMRAFINGAMRRGIADQAVRAATVTLYIDKAPFRGALNLPDEDRIYVLLVDREGKVHWRAAKGRLVDIERDGRRANGLVRNTAPHRAVDERAHQPVAAPQGGDLVDPHVASGLGDRLQKRHPAVHVALLLPREGDQYDVELSLKVRRQSEMLTLEIAPLDAREPPEAVCRSVGHRLAARL